MREAKKRLSIVITRVELNLLIDLDFPCSEKVLAGARETEEGFKLKGSRLDFEELVGWVAAEANHSRGLRRAELLNSIADQIECVL